MAATPHMLVLFEKPARELRVHDEHLDPKDDARLRELLIAQVSAHFGDAKRDLSRYWLRVRRRGMGGAPSTIVVRRVEVDTAGRTVIKR